MDMRDYMVGTEREQQVLIETQDWHDPENVAEIEEFEYGE